ncbi:MAG: CPBP family intramembrane glutamic endopeptidase [Devosia sp.]
MSNVTKIVIFYAMALGASLTIALFLVPIIGAYALPIVMMTPLASVLIMKLIVTREGYRRAGWSDLGLGTLGLRVWELAFGLPFMVLLISYGIVWAIGIAGVSLPADPIDFLLNVAISFFMGLVLCLGEEIGWRGYLLPKLLPYGRTFAMVVTGLLQALWHVPFLVFTTVYHGEGNALLTVPLFVMTMTIAGILFGYLRIAGKSTWPAAIAHSIFNSYWTMFNALTVAASPLAFEYLAGESGVLTLIGVIVSASFLIRRLDTRYPVRPVVA